MRPHRCDQRLCSSYPTAQWCSVCGANTLHLADTKHPLPFDTLPTEELARLRKAHGLSRRHGLSLRSLA